MLPPFTQVERLAVAGGGVPHDDSPTRYVSVTVNTNEGGVAGGIQGCGVCYHDNSLSSNYMVQTATDDRPSGAPPLPDVLQFMQLLWAVTHGLERASKRMTIDIGVTGPQRLVLRVVALRPGMSAGDVAAILHVHPSTLTGVLHRLVAQRLLARRHDPHDRRRAVLRLTARGDRINAVGRGTVEAVVAHALADSTREDRAATRRVLERLATHLQPPAAVLTRQPSVRRNGRRS